MKQVPLTPMFWDEPCEFSPQQEEKIEQLVKFAQSRVRARKQVKALYLELIDLQSQLLWVLEQRLQLLTQ